jgi:hypothetical protein
MIKNGVIIPVKLRQPSRRTKISKWYGNDQG